ncbi:MAG: ribosome maturation factor RimM [Tagaea sp.]|nr:ribosome maturation factor RimM [Tagaea sp.]
MSDAAGKRVLIGAIAAAHGVRGEVKIKTFTGKPADVAAYGPVEDESGKRRFEIRKTGVARGLVIARLAGIEDRDAAEALRGMRLYVGRDALGTKPKGSGKAKELWFHADLIGLRAVDTKGASLGEVKSVLNHGAGDILEVTEASGETRLFPFTKRVVTKVDIAAGRIEIDPPEWIEAKPEEEA